jgi:hypothetical protein
MLALIAVTPSAAMGAETVVVSKRPALLSALPSCRISWRTLQRLSRLRPLGFHDRELLIQLADLRFRLLDGGFRLVERGFRVRDRVGRLMDFLRVVRVFAASCSLPRGA